MLRIGVDATMLQPVRTGVGNYVFNLLRAYRALRPEVALVLFSNDAVSDEAKAFGECVEHVAAPVKKGPLWMSTGLPPLLKRCAVDVFWGGNGYLPLVVPARVRRVVTIHDFVYRHAGDTIPGISRLSRRILQPLAIRQADALVCVSQSTAREVRELCGRTADAVLEPLIDAAYRPAPTAEIEALRRRHGLPARFMLTIGTLEPRKNLVALLRAYVRVRERGVPLPQLVLAGRIGWLSDDIRATLDRATSRGFVRFLGYVPQPELPALYSAAEVFLFVPLYEGFGMPAREALLCGTPVIASDIGAMQEATLGRARLIAPNERSIERALLDYPSPGFVREPASAALRSDDAIPGAFAELLERAAALRRSA